MKMKPAILTLFFLLVTVWSIESQTVIKLWGDHPDNRKMKRTELLVYRADSLHNSGASVIICPGGSYCYLGMNHEGRQVAKWFQSRGINAFVLYYRVGMFGNHYPSMIQDLQKALVWVKSHADAFALQKNKVGVMGFSAGGHLVGTSGIYYNHNYLQTLGEKANAETLRPAFVAMIYPVVSMQDSIAHRKSRRNLLTKHYTNSLRDSMSLELNVHKNMPPVFMIQCRDDETVDYRNAEVFHKALDKAGVQNYYKLYPTGNHGFGMKPKGPEWNNSFITWLQSIKILQ
jgi:acetyl esterase/lipase